jgi:hypothetical protein
MTSHRRTRITRNLSAGLVAIALAAPASQASPLLEPGSGKAVGAPAETPAETTVIDEGFDWGSAAIGAGGAAVVVLLGAAGASALSPRRHGTGVTR